MKNQEELKRTWEGSGGPRFVAHDPSTGFSGVILEVSKGQYIFKNLDDECENVFSSHTADDVQGWELIRPGEYEASI